MKNERREVLAEDGPASKKLIIKLGEYKGHRLFELRFHYFNKKEQDFTPTRKGLSLTRSNYLTVKKVIEKNHEQVMDWLGVSYVPQHVEENQVAQEKAYKETEYSSGEVCFKTKKYFRDPDFFKAQHEGGQTTVIFNEEHPFFNSISDILVSGEIGEKAIAMIASMLVAYSTAKLRLKDSPSSHPEILFEQLEYDWSEYLKNKENIKI